MKTFITLLFLLLLISGIYAQIPLQITASNNPNQMIGKGWLRMLVSSNVYMQQTGTNAVWNYHDFVLDNISAEVVAYPHNGTYLSDSFPTSEMIWKAHSFNNLDTFDMHYYYDFDSISQKYYELGYSAVYDNTMHNEIAQNKIPLFKQNFLYGDTFIDTVYKRRNNNTLGIQLDTFTVNVSYNAFGTLILPFDTLHNIIFIKTKQSDSFVTKYDWYETSPIFRTVMTVIGNASGTKQFYINAFDKKLNLNNAIKADFYLYPNPAKEKICIESKQHKLQSLTILTLDGKQISSQAIDNQEKVFIDISDYASGMYFLRLVDTNGNISYLKYCKE